MCPLALSIKLATRLAVAPILVACCVVACDSSPGSEPESPGSFESDIPGGDGRYSEDDGLVSDGAGGSGGLTGGPRAPEGAPERAIVEADIVQVAGSTLYALSRVAGLSIIDIADPARLRLLGTFRELPGQPFEMYLRDGVILAMYSNWGQYVRQADGAYQFVQTSKLVALDVTQPARIQNVGSFDVAGEVSDSRLVGDVLYVVGYQNGYCWNCEQNKPQTSIQSLDVRDARAIRSRDHLEFQDAGSYSWGRRSVTVTGQRMYVAGPEYGYDQPTGSTIQIVDISDPGGDLVPGATVRADGMITSRWQMDEYESVLRIVSQPAPWTTAGAAAPSVQTFRVASSSAVSPLGRTNLVIPPNETLQSARFDGPRGYAITAERTDPLFTIDLSDPAQPRQVGELVMPGFVYHMEPRGNRVIGLGFDQGNPAGGITVSLFDVEDLASPKLLDRVNFGGEWGNLPEDQNRIHKAFKIASEIGLILVPFSGWSDWTRNERCAGQYRSGVQLVDLMGDDLTLRGAAPSRGEARRAILHQARLLTISDESVDAYDISRRDAPAALGKLTIARNVSRALPLANGSVARINEDWYGTQNSSVDLVELANVDRPEHSLGEVKLAEILSPGSACSQYTWVEDAFAQGNQINITYQRYGTFSEGVDVRAGLLTLDASDPTNPRVASKLEWDPGNHAGGWGRFYGYYRYGYSPPQTSALRTANALVLLEQQHDYSGHQVNVRARVIDLRDPSKPLETTVALPAANAYSGLVQDGGDVLVSHYQVTRERRARFYVSRIQLSDPSAPVLGAGVNVPGSLIHFDRPSGRAITSELSRVVAKMLTFEECNQRFAYNEFTALGSEQSTPDRSPIVRGTCTGLTQRLHLVRLASGGAVREDTLALDEKEIITSSSLSDGRLLAVLGNRHAYWYGGITDCLGPCGSGYAAEDGPATLLSVGGFESGKFSAGRLEVSGLSEPWWGFWGSPSVYTSGQRALVLGRTDAAVVDLRDAAAPRLERTVPLYSSPNQMHAAGRTVLLALGFSGVQRIEL